MAAGKQTLESALDRQPSSRNVRPFNMEIDTFTGGIFDTNCFFLPQHRLLIDAPQDSAEWLSQRGHRVETLLLTHGHIDHVWDAAQIQSEHQCRVGYHIDGEPMITERDFFRQYGFGWEIEPIRADWRLDEPGSETIGGVEFQILFVPGHCPGSLCFFAKDERILFAGDTLFAGGVGPLGPPGRRPRSSLQRHSRKNLPTRRRRHRPARPRTGHKDRHRTADQPVCGRLMLRTMLAPQRRCLSKSSACCSEGY